MNDVDAHVVDKQRQKELEVITAEVEADIAVVLPDFPDSVEPDVQVELDYSAIASAVNDYIEHYTIDPRIDIVKYKLSIPKLPDDEATFKLQEVLTGNTDEVDTITGVVHVNNEAIADDKVTTKFELSVEENVYLNEDTEEIQSSPSKKGSRKLSQQKENADSPQTNTSEPKLSKTSNGANQTKNGLIIQSAEPKLYWEKAPSDTSQSSNTSPHKEQLSKDEIIHNSLQLSNSVGQGLDRASDSISNTFKNAKVGDNGNVYLNKHARGNGSYKIVGKVADNKTVKKLGTYGKLISYGATAIQTSEEVKKAKTAKEKGMIIGGVTGKITAGTAAGAVASAATTAVLVTIAGAAGVAAAPVTLVIIAGCSIVAATAASTAVEQHGEYWGAKAGEKAVDIWQNRTKK